MDVAATHPAQVDLARVFSSVRLLGPPMSDKVVRLVSHLFTPEEAAIAVHLPFYKPRPLSWIASRAGRTELDIEPTVRAMADKRVILEIRRTYSLIPLIPGMFENMLISGVDTPWHREYAQLLDDVFRTGYVREYTWRPTRAVRNIPVQQVIENHQHVVSVDLISEMIRAHDDLAVANVCQCRQSLMFRGKECKRSSPADGCLIFGSLARGLVKSGDGRFVSRDEMRSIVDDRWKKKLVFLTGNVSPTSPNAICTCCDCCCHMLEAMNDYGGMPLVAPSHFVAQVDEASCTSCMKCAKACNTRAHELIDRKHRFHKERCIGCGLCVPACTEQSVQMAVNPAYRKPPEGILGLSLKMLPATALTGIKVRLARGS
ncbi:MAG: 4Fe-4S binding protein [Deltaproteobacteria bacterium]|nr:4Fe-4S binding protein [Deltaproteobacteria bacterium]